MLKTEKKLPLAGKREIEECRSKNGQVVARCQVPLLEVERGASEILIPNVDSKRFYRDQQQLWP